LTQIPVGNYYWPILVSIFVSSSFPMHPSHVTASFRLRTLRLIECLNLISIWLKEAGVEKPRGKIYFWSTGGPNFCLIFSY